MLCEEVSLRLFPAANALQWGRNWTASLEIKRSAIGLALVSYSKDLSHRMRAGDLNIY
jgi:hypothetical protein